MTAIDYTGPSDDELARAPWCAPPDPRPRKPVLALPAGACDTHFHVFGPIERHPYWSARIYTPPDAPLSAHRRLLAVLGVARAVIVQPSVYGTDNTVTLDALAAGGKSMRAVVVVDESITDDELKRLHRAGVRGIRYNVVDVAQALRGRLPMDAVRRMAARLAPLGWHIQFLMHVNEFPEIATQFAALPVPIVIDHFGYVPADRGIDDPGFRGLTSLVESGRAYVKFTGAYRISRQPMPYEDVTPFAHALVRANPERILWGTDWPHPKHEGPMPNDGALCERLAEWIPAVGDRELALVANPERLYGF